MEREKFSPCLALIKFFFLKLILNRTFHMTLNFDQLVNCIFLELLSKLYLIDQGTNKISKHVSKRKLKN